MRQTVAKWDAEFCTQEVLPGWKRVARYLAGLAGKNVFEPQWFVPEGDPASHPGCSEILEIGPDGVIRTIHQRNK